MFKLRTTRSHQSIVHPYPRRTSKFPEPSVEWQRITDVGAGLLRSGARDGDASGREIPLLGLKRDDGVPIVKFTMSVV